MPAPKLAFNGLVFVDNEPVSYTDIVQVRDITPVEQRAEGRPVMSFEFQTTYAFEGTFLAETMKPLREAFGIQCEPTMNVQYKAGLRWFHPTLTFDRTRIVDFGPEPMNDIVHLDMVAQECKVEYPNFWARPVYWLWRQWMTCKRAWNRMCSRCL